MTEHKARVSSNPHGTRFRWAGQTKFIEGP